MKPTIATFLWLTSLALAACQTERIDLTLLTESSYCSLDDELQLLTDTQSVNSVLGQTKILGAEKAEFALDLQAFHYVAVGMGQRPTAGYTIELAAQSAEVKNGTLQLPLKLNSPPADAVLAQVITQPCIVIELEKGSYSSVSAELSGTQRTLKTP